MKVEFDWEEFRKLESSLSPVEEIVIGQHLAQMIEGNSHMEDYDQAEQRISAEQFRLGWLCARLAMESRRRTED